MLFSIWGAAQFLLRTQIVLHVKPNLREVLDRANEILGNNYLQTTFVLICKESSKWWLFFFSFRCLDSKVHPQPSETLHAHTTVFLHICKHIYMQIVLPFRKVYSDLKDCFGMVHHTLVHLQCACIGVVCYRDSTESWRQRLERCGTGCTQ